MKNSLLSLACLAFASTSHAAVTLAGWTFETTLPTTAGPFAAETGVFAGTSAASTNSGGTISNPAGNGSAESFSSTGWAAGEYYQFTTATTGYENLVITYSQAASNTGPRDFQFQYSTDGTTYIDFGTAFAGPTSDFNGGLFNPLNVLTFDLSAIPELDNQPLVGFRIVIVGASAENGTTLASGGTFRVDDFTVSSVPEASSLLLGAIGVLGILRRRR